MKRKIKFLLFVGFVAVSSYGVFQGISNRKITELSDLTLANVEALAEDEGCGGLADLNAAIWHVTVQIGGSLGKTVFPSITCTTGGCYVCAKGK